MSMERTHTLQETGHGAHDFEQGSIFFVGTATVILRFGGLTILTDPNFLHSGDHVHLGYGLTSKRLTNPAMDIEQLPPLDLCVLSHLHGDHFDRIAEEKLDKSLPIITTRHAASSLKRKGFTSTYGLDTWESFSVVKGESRLRITSMPGKHGPGMMNALLPPVMGSMLEFQDGAGETKLNLYISGDTLVHDDLKEIPKRYPVIEIALMHLGGTKILGVTLTMNAKQGVEATKLVRARTTIPIHYNDYTVFKSPLEDFKRAIRAAGLETQVVYLNHGDTYNFEVGANPRSSVERGNLSARSDQIIYRDRLKGEGVRIKKLQPLPHAVMDYAWAGAMIAAPWLFGFNKNKTATINSLASGGAILGLSLMTDYPLGAVKKIPFPTHGVIETVAGIATAAAPWLMGFSRNKRATWTHVISGLATLGVVALTDYRAQAASVRRGAGMAEQLRGQQPDEQAARIDLGPPTHYPEGAVVGAGSEP